MFVFPFDFARYDRLWYNGISLSIKRNRIESVEVMWVKLDSLLLQN